ncbi:DUF4254 domain-containing protein [Nocardia sp. NPDC052566]|uniref:DUF4254 domain-containing protein n=1 Tax=Nocardia sp. NPDC052566 TaxID=3364330 RepID=UPI0037C89F00
MTSLPSRDEILEAFVGHLIRKPDPVLYAAMELAGLHKARLRAAAEGAGTDEIDHRRTILAHSIDCWVAVEVPHARQGALLHTETVGAVIDRLARFCVAAHEVLMRSTSEVERHHAWQRLAELAVAYGDMVFEVSAGIRRVPDLGGVDADATE